MYVAFRDVPSPVLVRWHLIHIRAGGPGPEVMNDWCTVNCRGRWTTGIGWFFEDEVDAVTFRIFAADFAVVA